MSESLKILKKMAFDMDGRSRTGWGVDNATPASAIPYTENSVELEIAHEQDQSILGSGFQSVPYTVKKHGSGSFSTPLIAWGTSSLRREYWRFGFVHPSTVVGCFVFNTPTIEPVQGAVYYDAGSNNFTFLRKEVGKVGTWYIFRADSNAVPTLSTGTLTKTSGTGDDTLTFTEHAPKMYEHVFELDSLNRHVSTFETFERVSGWGSGYKKVRSASIAFAYGTNDFLYQNAMCRKFSVSSQAGKLVTCPNEFIAYSESRGDYGSASWTYAAEIRYRQMLLLHHNMKAEIGESLGALTEVGVSNLDLSVDIPLQVDQDTVSGQHLMEPVMEGKYGISCTLDISRHSVNTFQAYRDADTPLISRFMYQAVDPVSPEYYMLYEFMINHATLKKAGPDDSPVAREPLDLIVGYDSTCNWTDWLYPVVPVHQSPVLCRIRNTVSTNVMFST